MPRDFTPLKNNEVQTKEIGLLSQSGLDFLIADPEELVRFMKVSGYDPDALRASIDTPELNLAIMSYFASNEPSLLAMCANANIDVTRFMRCWNQQNAPN